MRQLLCALLLILLVASAVSADTLFLSSDSSLLIPCFTSTGTLQFAYVIHQPTIGAIGSRFSVVFPPCLDGWALWLSDTAGPGVTLFGNSQIGIEATYASCQSSNVLVTTIAVFTNAVGQPVCCQWFVQPDPNDPSGQAKSFDCSGGEMQAITSFAAWNDDGSGCGPFWGPCGTLPTEPSTWGRVKSLYGKD